MALGEDGIVNNADRGGEPPGWVHARMSPAVVFTWHHTIPWNRLRAVWNGLVRGRHWDAVDLFLQLAQAPNRQSVLQQIKAGHLVEDRDALLTRLTWQGWNIVEGPGGEFRTPDDDPGERSEHWSTIGMSSNQAQTAQAVQALDVAMALLPAALGDGTGPVTDAQAAGLAASMRRVKQAVRHAPMPWSEAMWVRTREGRVEKGAAVWSTRPQWRARRKSDPV